MRGEGMLLSSRVRVCALETWTPHLDNTQTPSSPLPRSSSHRKEAQAHRLDWSYIFWPFPDLSKWTSREISHTSLGTYKSDWLWDLRTGKTSLGATFMSVSIWVFWNPYVLEIRITLTRNSATKMEGSAFSAISVHACLQSIYSRQEYTDRLKNIRANFRLTLLQLMIFHSAYKL